MSDRLALSLVKLRQQLDQRFPGRSKVSDGAAGDARHQAYARAENPEAPWTVSQHIANAAGIYCAIDVTEDLAVGLDCRQLQNELDASDDGRLFYTIHDGQLDDSDDVRSTDPTYGHPSHLHISVRFDRPSLYDNERPWSLPMLGAFPLIPPSVRIPSMRDEMYLTRNDDDDRCFLWTSRGAIYLRNTEEIKAAQLLTTTAPGDLRSLSARFHRMMATILARPVSATL